jgi:DNA-directed RNA polymerase omega subunit
MARITTRDCEQVVPNRFELVILAARRAHDLWNGAEAQVEPGDEKPTVLALREIAARQIDPDILRQELIKRFAATGIDAVDCGKPPVRELAQSFPSGGAASKPPGGSASAPVHYH